MPCSVTASRVRTRGNVKVLQRLFNFTTWEPRPKARAGGRGPSARGRDPAREVAEVAGHALQLVGGTLEAREGERLFLGRRRHRFGTRPVAVGNAGDAADSVLQPRAFLLLVARDLRD